MYSASPNDLCRVDLRLQRTCLPLATRLHHTPPHFDALFLRDGGRRRALQRRHGDGDQRLAVAVSLCRQDAMAIFLDPQRCVRRIIYTNWQFYELVPIRQPLRQAAAGIPQIQRLVHLPLLAAARIHAVACQEPHARLV